MTFAENINRICKARGVTLTAFIKSLGISTKQCKPEHLIFRKTLLRVCLHIKGSLT